MINKYNKHFFMSHATVAESITEQLMGYLENEGYKCWFAQRDVQLGEHYASELSHALTTSAAVILVLDTNANKSKHVLREITIAIEKYIPVFVVQFGNFPISEGLDYLLSGIQKIYAEVDAYETPSKKLIEQISKTITTTNAKESDWINPAIQKNIIEIPPNEWDFASKLTLPDWLRKLFEVNQ